MNLVDSSAWLEYFVDGPNAKIFSKPLNDLANLLVPTICLYEVFKVVLRERSEDNALRAIALMQQGKIIELTSETAILAAKNSIDYRIPMADSIILATAQMCDATIWTQDSDFKNISGVKYFPKIKS
jgi:predicted nucleic acid-binding protein